ncbi:glycerate dehydrogenase [Terrimonas sp.]|uniref:D-2-hydroxyacid dehydrogenase n=1 Tax=Terrimonas sp. TaxID=1914338 RepID=UPI000D506C1C|nr:D-2-hydroxyacid dehydrogenase [Terrimonas sp.]PVD49458.1 glycerate dehydrogenase [Terrimonas sp.]
MNIVILDGYTLNPGDLDWLPLEKIGRLKVYERTAVDDVVERAIDAEIVLTNKTKITGDAIKALPRLKYIGELATGFDNVDIKAAKERNIPVCNVPGYSSSSVAQLTAALMLELIYKTGRRSDEAKGGAWVNSKDFCYGHAGLFELQGKTMALIGLGQIGSAVAKLAMAFGMRVIASVRNPAKYNMEGINFVSREECFSAADFVSLHCPLTDDTRQMVNASLISIMKPSAYIINTARGALINEKDLADALNSSRIAGAALDVLSTEPPSADNPVFNAANCIITPHIAWATKEARTRLLNESIKNIEAFLKGEERNVVNLKI